MNENDAVVGCLYNQQNVCPHWRELKDNQMDGQAMVAFCITCQLCRIADHLKILTVKEATKRRKRL